MEGDSEKNLGNGDEENMSYKVSILEEQNEENEEAPALIEIKDDSHFHHKKNHASVSIQNRSDYNLNDPLNEDENSSGKEEHIVQ